MYGKKDGEFKVIQKRASQEIASINCEVATGMIRYFMG